MWRTKGHDEAVGLLQSSLAGGNTSHAYLLTGPARIGKATLARELAMALNCTTWQGEPQPTLFGALEPAPAGPPGPCYECPSCTKILAGAHPDVSIVEEWVAARSSIIDQIRAIQYAAGLLPYEGRWKVYVLLNADQLTLPAQNALLKTLEEPAPTVRIILSAPTTQSLLPTVVSRCQQLPLRTPSRADIASALRELKDLEPERAQFLAGLAGGRIGWALQAAGDETLLDARVAGFARLADLLAGDLVVRFKAAEELAARATSDIDSVRETLRLWLTWLRDLLLLVEGCPDLVVNADQLTTLQTAAGRLGSREVQAAVRALQQASGQVDGSTNSRLALEVLMLRLPSLTVAER